MSVMADHRARSLWPRLGLACLILAIFGWGGSMDLSSAREFLESDAAHSGAAEEGPSNTRVEASDHADDWEITEAAFLPEFGPGPGLFPPPAATYTAGPIRPPLRPPAL